MKTGRQTREPARDLGEDKISRTRQPATRAERAMTQMAHGTTGTRQHGVHTGNGTKERRSWKDKAHEPPRAEKLPTEYTTQDTQEGQTTKPEIRNTRKRKRSAQTRERGENTETQTPRENGTPTRQNAGAGTTE